VTRPVVANYDCWASAIGKHKPTYEDLFDWSMSALAIVRQCTGYCDFIFLLTIKWWTYNLLTIKRSDRWAREMSYKAL
jgi:hypothetical protein